MTDEIEMMVDLKPVSLETEQHLIGAILRGGRSTFERVKDFITAEMFWSVSHRNVWNGLEKIYAAGLQLDVVIVGDEMERMLKMGEIAEEWGNGIRNGRAYLSDLRRDGDPRNVESYAEQVQDYYIKRHLLNYSSKIASWSMSERRGKDIMSDIESDLSKITLFSAQDEHTVSIAEAVSEAYDWTDRAARGEIVGVPTGFIDLDHILGSMIAGNVYIVAGRPKQGKTALLLSIAHNAAKSGKRVGMFSLEMSRIQVAQRLIAMESGVSVQSSIQGTLKDSEWPSYTNGVELAAALPIVINDLSSINISQIRQTARKMKAAGGLDLIVVDYIQLAGSDAKKFERRDLEVSAVSRGLKWLAGELNVPILAAAQLSRAVEQRANQRPVLSDLRESGSLEQDAYAVMFIYRTEDLDKQNAVELIVAAHRNGPVGSCNLMFRGALTKFENATSKTFKLNE
jgi:replicative DNA helicase